MTLTTDRFEASRGLFATAELLVAPVRESQLEYWHNVSYEKKLKWWVYQMVKDSLRMCLRVSTQYTNVMDEQTAWLGYSRAAKKVLIMYRMIAECRPTRLRLKANQVVISDYCTCL